MRHIVGFVAGAALLLASTLVAATPAASASSAVGSGTGCETSELQLAPSGPGANDDRDPDGRPISTSPGPKGLFVPVIMVHGWNGSAATFTQKIDQTANRIGTVSARTSLVGQLQDMPGTAVYSFDYHRWSDRWVTDAHIGRALATAIHCLYQSSNQKVILVAHSMGGLAIEQTFAEAIPGVRSLADEISTIVTIGTPFKGSVIDSVAHGATLKSGVIGSLGGSAFLTVATALLSACGRVSTANADNVCTAFAPLTPVMTLHSDAANALQYDSAQIRQLPAVPDSIHLVQLAGDIGYETQSSWFRLVRKATTVHVGDSIVTHDSAVPSPSKENEQVTCTYTLSFKQAAADQLEVILGQRAKNDARSVPITDINPPCAHGQLPRDVELTNAALGAVYDDVHARVETALQRIATSITLPAGVCYQRPATLRAGRFIIPDSNGDGEIDLWTKWPTENDPDNTQPAIIADGRSQMADKYRGAIAVKVVCSASGAGGGYTFIAVYTNSLQPVGLVNVGTLHTAYGFALPSPSDTVFSDGALRTRVTWQDTDSIEPNGGFSNDCPVTTVQLEYALTPSSELTPGEQTTIAGDPGCGFENE